MGLTLVGGGKPFRVGSCLTVILDAAHCLYPVHILSDLTLGQVVHDYLAPSVHPHAARRRDAA
jgi:hypothetical protein